MSLSISPELYPTLRRANSVDLLGPDCGQSVVGLWAICG